MNAPPPITVAVSCFADLLALGLHALLEDDPSLAVVARDIAPARLDVVLRAHHPRVLVLDLGALRDLVEVRELGVHHPQTHIVLLTGPTSAAESAQLLAFGASACLTKDTEARDVRNAIHLASRGLQLMPRRIEGSGDAHVADTLLTPREGEVLQLLREGRSNREIALDLQIAVETVRSHARNIFRKLGVSSRRALMTLPAQSARPEPPTDRSRRERLLRHPSRPGRGAQGAGPPRR